MPDRVLNRPVRKFAGAAVFVSASVHVLLILGLWFLTEQTQDSVPSRSTNDLIVLVGEADRRREVGVGIDVTLVSTEQPSKGDSGPFSPVTQPRVVDANPVATPVDPSSEPIPRVRGPRPATRSGAGTNESQGGSNTRFFEVSATGRTVVYVLDRSMSMGVHDGLKQARAELLASLSRLPPTAQFQVIPYNQFAEPLSVHNYGGMLPADADTLTEVERLIAALRATGRTNHVQALLCGLKLRPDVVFFVTDADELTAREVDDVSLYNSGRCSIHVIDLNPRTDDTVNALRRLALQNRGTYRHVGVKEF